MIFDELTFDEQLANLNSENPRLVAIKLDSLLPAQLHDLLNALKNNTTVKALTLGSKSFDGYDIELLAEVLRNNKTITTLRLQSCDIDDKKLKALANGLEGNENIIILELPNNKISEASDAVLANIVRTCPQLDKLDISDNEIVFSGSSELLNALKVSKRFKSIDLSDQTIDGEDGMNRIIELIESNQALESLGLNNTVLMNFELTRELADKFIEAVENNPALKSVALDLSREDEYSASEEVFRLENRILEIMEQREQNPEPQVQEDSNAATDTTVQQPLLLSGVRYQQQDGDGATERKRSSDDAGPSEGLSDGGSSRPNKRTKPN
jgi:hypothetical protein